MRYEIPGLHAGLDHILCASLADVWARTLGRGEGMCTQWENRRPGHYAGQPTTEQDFDRVLIGRLVFTCHIAFAELVAPEATYRSASSLQITAS